MANRNDYLFVAPLVFLFLTCSPLHAKQDVSVSTVPQQGFDELVRPITEKILLSAMRKIVVIPLADSDDNLDALGGYLSQEVSQRLAKAIPGTQIVDSGTLHLPSTTDLKLDSSNSDTERLKNLAWAAGADICVLGDFAPFKDEIGASLHVWSSDGSLLADSYGGIPLTREMRDLASKPLKYAPPPDGIFTAGRGGVSRPIVTESSASNLQNWAHKTLGAGIVSMELVIGPEGSVQRVTTLTSSSVSLASRVQEKYNSLRFTPAAAPDGTPVAVRVHSEFAVVELELTVATDGRVQQALILKSPNQGFSERALRAVQKWKLKPAIGPGGNPVAVKVKTEITFALY
jgi:TonB family protein